MLQFSSFSPTPSSPIFTITYYKKAKILIVSSLFFLFNLKVKYLKKKLCKKYNFILNFIKNYVYYITNKKKYLIVLCLYLIMLAMQINFSTSRLELLYLGDEKEVLRARLDFTILKAYRKAIFFLSNTVSFPEIWKVRGYNLEKIDDHWSIRLNDQRRLEIKFTKEKDREIQVVDILQISNHYNEIIR